tara:strand:+ start:292 stop:744 length:453 start_codon:yes stop_codon:yes gene_type:complete
MLSLKKFIKSELNEDVKYYLYEFLSEYRDISKSISEQKVTAIDFDDLNFMQFTNFLSHYGIVGVYNYDKSIIRLYTKYMGYTLLTSLESDDLVYKGSSEESEYDLFELKVGSELEQYFIKKFKLCILSGKSEITEEEKKLLIQNSIKNFD